MIFSQSTALDLAKKIAALYDRRLVANINCAATDTQVLLFSQKDRIEIIFPGTASAQDVITDLRAAKLRWGHGAAHAGFSRAWLSVRKAVTDAIPSDTPVVIAGHSLGGALAMLAADSLPGYNVLAVFTFGQPRVFNGPAARDCNRRLANRTFRIVNHGDPIPRIPWMFGTYRHAGTEVQLTDAGIVVDPSLWSKAQERISEIATGAPGLSRGLALFNHHRIQAYIERLERV